jgi:putative DNA primase/helicase
MTQKVRKAAVGHFQFNKDGIHLIDKHKRTIRVADPILVAAFATSDPGTPREQAFIVIKFMNRRGRWKKEIISASMLITHRTDFTTLLSNRGYAWPSNRELRSKIIAALSAEKPSRDIRVTDVPGWHGKSFVLPGEAYTPDGPDPNAIQIKSNPTVQLGAFRRSGTLGQWKKYVAKTCVHSSRARFAVATVFAAPNLRPLQINTFGINFSGPTSGGKTLLLRLAASAAGLNSKEGPQTWDGSTASFEQRALGHRDSIMPLDDISHLVGGATQVAQLAKLVTFRLTSNRPKAKAGQYILAHQLIDTDWRVIPLSTSEDPLWEQVGLQNRVNRRVRGEEVRMINVRACISDVADIFDGRAASEHVGGTLDQRLRFVERQERRAVKYQGEAYRVYIRKRIMDKMASETLIEYIDEYIKATPLADEFRWLGRIRRFFAVVYASAARAIDYKILPWRKKSTLKAIAACMNDAMEQLTAHSGKAASDADAKQIKSESVLLTEFKEHVDKANFVRISRGRAMGRLPAGVLKNANGVIRPSSPGKIQYLLFAETLDAWFPDVTERNRLTKILRSRGICGKGRRPDTNTRQVFIARLGRVPCYALLRKRLQVP